ncbi:MAG: glutaredoxin family protein [Gammaproteobacteria bacterium]|jgi:hypothetical protein
MAEKKLILYGRHECHLCQDMLTDLEVLRKELDFELDFIDVDKDRQLVERYGMKVPVLVGAGQEICHYFLDKQSLFNYFERR